MAATSNPVCCWISWKQVGLVTLISVTQSPITSTPAAVIITGTIALAGGTALGVRAVTILSRTISDTRPLRHLVWTLVAEADAPRPQEPTVWAMDDPTRLDAARDGARVRVITADHLFED